MILRADSLGWQELAHLLAERSWSFSQGQAWAKLFPRAPRLSHLCRVQALNYRYPSPSRWSGPIFRTGPALLAAFRRQLADHNCGGQGGFAFVKQAFHNKMDAGHNKKGSVKWTTGKLDWHWLVPSFWPGASLTTQNAPSQVQPRARLSLTRLAAALLRGPSLAAQPALTATTQDFAKKTSGAGLTRARPLTANRAVRFAPLIPDMLNPSHRDELGLAASGLACR